MLGLRILGAVDVTADGVAIPIRSLKQRLILAHLALARGKAVSEQLLLAELWSTPPRNPLHALQAHVSRLRQTLGLPIEYGVGGYLVDGSAVTVDAVRFEELLAAAKASASEPGVMVETLEEALGLWRGPALEDLPLTSRLHSQRGRLELLYDEATTELIEAYLAVGRFDDALLLLQDAVVANPVDERRWGQLMIALDRSGQRSEALAVYARAREQLVELVGLEPNAHLQQIQRDILNGTLPSATVVDPAGGPGAEVPPGLVGRDLEWDVLRRMRRDAQTEQRIVLLTGEPGIGKTYLASCFTAALRPGEVHSSRCDGTRGVPYESLAQLIRSSCAGLAPAGIRDRLGPGAASLHDLVPDVVHDAGVAVPTASREPEPHVDHHRIKLALFGWLRRAAAAAPLCLMIDDLQWADAESLRLLAELWAQPEALPILWIATVRDEEHAPHSPRATLIDQVLRPSEAVTQLRLEGLPRPAVTELMQSTMGAEADDQLATEAVDDVLRKTGGNPLFVLATARHLREHHLSDLTGTVPSSLASVVSGLAARLEESHRQLLDVAAVIGEEVDPVVLGVATGSTPAELDEFLAHARRLRLLEPADASGMRHKFRHGLVQSVVLQQISPMRRARLHLDVARAVETHPHAPDRLHVLAYHHARAVSLTGADEAVKHVLAAAEASQRQRAPAVALDLYRTARDLLTDDSPDDQRCEVLLGLGEAGFRAGADHRDDLLAAARLAHRIGDADRLVRAAVANNRGWYSNLTEVDRDRVSVIEAALGLLPDDVHHRPERSHLLALWAMENVRDPALREEVLARSRESLRIAEGVQDDELLGEIMCHRFSILFATSTDPRATFDFAKGLDDFAHARVDPELQLKSAIAVAQSAMTVADFQTADRALERSRQLAHELAHPPRMWLVNTWLATRSATRGDFATANSLAAEAMDMGIAFEQPDAFTWFAGQLFVFHHMTDQLPVLIDSIEQQVAELTDQIPAWRAAYAVALTTVERWHEARGIVDEFCATDFSQLPVDVLYLQSLSYLADASARLGHADAAPVLYAALLPHEGLVATNSVIDAGPVDLRLGQLALLQGDTHAARRHLRAAEAFCREQQTPVWLEPVLKAAAAVDSEI